MNIESQLSPKIKSCLGSLFGLDISIESIVFQKTNHEFEGDITLVVFPYSKAAKKSPEDTGQLIGNHLLETSKEITSFNVVKGFLNLVIADSFWLEFFRKARETNHFGISPEINPDRLVMVEYSSPNTNKPIHLGHIRNNLLGYSISKILVANGCKVIKVNLINDRGIHICKSMLAWKKWGNGETPATSGMKGDHLVGKYYVEFEKQLIPSVKQMLAEWGNGIFNNLSEEVIAKVKVLLKNCEAASEKKKDQAKEELTDFAREHSTLMKEAKAMLLKWEQSDSAIRELWSMMNAWVYAGFEVTYKTLGVDFDKIYYESETYLLGKKIVEEGLAKKVFYKKEDGSVWIDLTSEGLDHKLLLRSDGTSVYMTQDLGTVAERFREFPEIKQLIYTVGNEQDYHFKVLFQILSRLGISSAKNCYHLSYGMVELPEGKMKSREGKVVDADDLIAEMIATAKEMTKELGKVDDFSEAEAENLYRMIGLAALKYFILKVDPKKKMIFDPKESIDFNGNTGPFIQYTYARIQSLLKRGSLAIAIDEVNPDAEKIILHPKEKTLLKCLYSFPEAIRQAGTEYNPGVVANYVYELAKEYSNYYQTVPILKEENQLLIRFRLQLSALTADVIKNAMTLLGIEVPERM